MTANLITKKKAWWRKQSFTLVWYLASQFGNRINYDAGSCLAARVSIVLINGEWRQKSARTEDIKTIQAGTSQIQLVENDRIVQALTKSGVFSCNLAREMFWVRKEKVEWWKLVWDSAIFPDSFILWLAIKERLPTQDRVAARGWTGDVLCDFCRNEMDRRNHLYFKPFFSF